MNLRRNLRRKEERKKERKKEVNLRRKKERKKKRSEFKKEFKKKGRKKERKKERSEFKKKERKKWIYLKKKMHQWNGKIEPDKIYDIKKFLKNLQNRTKQNKKKVEVRIRPSCSGNWVKWKYLNVWVYLGGFQEKEERYGVVRGYVFVVKIDEWISSEPEKSTITNPYPTP